MMKIFYIAVLIVISAFIPITDIYAADFGISPGKIYIENLDPGESASSTLTISNQGNTDIEFVISARNPDYTEAGYERLWNPDYVNSVKEITVPAKGSEQVNITISAPTESETELKKYELWIDVREKNPEELVATACDCRILISTTAEFQSVDIETYTKPIDWERPMLYGLACLCFVLAAILVMTILRKRNVKNPFARK